MASTFSLVFLAALAATTAIRLWLALRQIRHVQAHRDAVPAAFAATIPLDAHRRAADYTAARLRLAFVEIPFGALVLAALTVGGVLQWVFDLWAGYLDPATEAHGLAFIASAALLGFLAELPFGLWHTFVIEQRFGFNRTSARLFAIDLAKQAVILVLVGGPFVLAVLWLMGRMGEAWWLYVWLTWLAFNLLALLIYPTLIAPWFNRFSPLEDGALRARVEALLSRCGMRASGLFVMDGSKRSAHGNAYFTGFGASRRVVFFDTLLDKLDAGEIEAVLAHELGHYRLRHVWKRIGILAAAAFALLWLLGGLAGQAWFYQGLGMQGMSAGSALTLFSLVVPVFTFPLHPAASLMSRRHEFEADAFAASHASAPDLARALVKLYHDNAATLTPDALYSAFYDSHPAAAVRIARLNAR
ncbi:MAG: M48 family metallopeptidase [Rhodocyclaceae bacterium]